MELSAQYFSPRVTTSAIIRFTAFMYLLMVFLPLAHNYTRFGLSDVRYWGITVIFSVFLFRPNTFSNKRLSYVIFYWIFFLVLSYVFWYNVDDWNLRVAREEALRFIVPLTLFTYFTTSKDIKSYSFLVKWAMIFIFITSILSIYTASIDPLYVRMMTSSSYSVAELKGVRTFGGGGYGFVTTLLFLIPVLIYHIKRPNKTVLKVLLMIFLVLCYVTIFASQLFANILITIVISILSFGGTRSFKKSMIYSSFVTVLFFATPTQFFIDTLTSVSNVISPESTTYSKINDMSNFLQYGANIESESGMSLRLSRYPMLFDAFINSPLLGQYSAVNRSDTAEGGHLYWMNKLVIYGLLNFVFFVLIIYVFIKKVLTNLPKEYVFSFWLSIIAGLGYGFFKTIMGFDFWCMFFFLLPGLFNPNVFSWYQKNEIQKN